MKNLLLRIVPAVTLIATLISLFVFEDGILRAKETENSNAMPVSVAKAALNLVCPGSLIRLGGTDGIDPDIRERIGESELAIGSATQIRVLLGESEVSYQGNVSMHGLSASATVSQVDLEAPQGSENLTGAQVQSVEVARMQGLASSGCIQPSAESWLVAGSTQPGSETLLIVVNPSAITSTVTITAHLATGDSNADQLVVPAGETRLFQVDSLVQAESEFTLQVVASQGKVASFLQQRETSGLSALGVDLVTPAAGAAERVTVPGILVRGSELRIAGEVGNWLRVFNPSKDSVELLIEVVGSSTEEFGGVVQATVSAGNTVDIPLVGLPDGTYTAFVSASTPILAGAFSRGSASLEAKDIAWSQAASELDSTFAFAASRFTTGVQISNPSDGSITVSVAAASGTVADVIPPKSSRLYPVAAGFVRVDASTAGLVANLVEESELGFGLVALGRNQNYGSEVTVRVIR